jgi:hypothetical protein
VAIIFRPKGLIQKLAIERPWTHLVRMPGLRGNPEVEVTCDGQLLNATLVTPRRIRVRCSITICTAEIQIVSPNERIRWRHLPESLARSTSETSLQGIIHIPDELSPARCLERVGILTSVERVTTMKDRLIVKGRIEFNIEYRER